MFYNEIEIEGYERVVHAVDSFTGLDCFVAIHSTKLGPALGGCRIWKYNTDEDAQEDVLRLSRGMTYKNSLAGLDLGGGKAVINISNTSKTPELLRKFGELLNYLGGKYITAEDVGSSLKDMMVIREKTKYVASLDGAGDPSPATALGVLRGIEATVNFWRSGLEPCRSLQGVTVAIQGLGNVGYTLAQMLHQKGATIIATDLNQEACDRLQKETGATIVTPDAIHKTDCDVFAPCAMGGIINENTVDHIKAKIVCGSANNQLKNNTCGDMLHKKGIIYAPDYLVNAGGVMNVYREFGMVNSDFHLALMLDDIFARTCECLHRSAENDVPSYVVADQMAEERL